MRELPKRLDLQRTLLLTLLLTLELLELCSNYYNQNSGRDCYKRNLLTNIFINSFF
jgi:hypothetical protein